MFFIAIFYPDCGLYENYYFTENSTKMMCSSNACMLMNYQKSRKELSDSLSII